MTPPYVSPLREAQAAQTRSRVLDAAATVFSESGYAGASLAVIAKAAGVSVETVKQNGPKAALLLAAFDQAFSGAEGQGPLHDRAEVAALAEAPADGLVGALVAFVCDANARVAALWPRLLEGAASDASVAERVDALQRNRRSDMAAAIALLREHGLCRSAHGDDELAAALSFLISPEGYTQLVEESGWTPERYRSWTARAIGDLILR